MRGSRGEVEMDIGWMNGFIVTRARAYAKLLLGNKKERS
jgi:hypothetical protein